MENRILHTIENNDYNFKSRKSKVLSIKDYENNEKEFYLKVNESGYYFSNFTYNNDFFKNYLTQFKYNQLIEEINLIIEKILLKKVKYEYNDHFKIPKTIIFFNIVILLFSYLMSVIVFYFEPNNIIFYFGNIVSMVCLFFIIISIFFTVTKKNEFFWVDKKVFYEINEFIENKNYELIHNNNIKIFLHDNYFYLRFIKLK